MKILRPVSKQPIPSHAKCVFKGVLFDVYQWEQELFDGTRATFEKVKRKDTAICFPVLPDGRIMLEEQEQPGKPPFVSGVGGGIEEGEGVLEALKRELLEETGYEAERFVLWKAYQPLTKVDWAIYIFIAKGIKKIAEPVLDGGEKITSKYVTFDEFLELESNQDFLEKEIFEARFDKNKYEELKKLFDPRL